MMMIRQAGREKDLTEGVIWKQLLFFSLPFLASSLIQQLYNTVDVLFVGNLIGKEATAAVGASSTLITCIVGFFTGLSVGISVIAAQNAGAGKWQELDRIVHTGAGLSLAGGAILTAAGILLARPILLILNTPEEVLDAAVSYMRIYMLSMIPLVTYNMNAGIIRSLGNSVAPMLIQLAGGIINVAADFVFLWCLHMGVSGAACATFLSQGTAAVLSVLYMMRKAEHCRLRWRSVHIYGDVLRQVLRLGIPAGVQSAVITLSNLIVQSQINQFGVDVVAAFAAYFKVELLIYLPIVAFGQAMMTFAGQNKGAERTDRIRKGIRASIMMGVVYTIAAAAILMAAGDFVFGLFVQDTSVITCGISIISVTFPMYWIYVILEVMADTIRGTGRSMPPMVIIILTICVFRTVLLFCFVNIFGTVEAVAVVYPAAWAAAAVCLTLYWLRIRKRI